MAGLLDLFNGGGDIYGGMLSPEQKQALAYRGLLGAAGAFGEGAMPSRLPIPIGAVLGKAAAAMGSAQDEGATTALTALLRGTQAKKLQSEIDYAKQLGPSIDALNKAMGGLSGTPGTPSAAVPTGMGGAAVTDLAGGGVRGAGANPGSLAMAETSDIQEEVAKKLATASGIQHWAGFNPKLAAALQSSGLPLSGPLSEEQWAKAKPLILQYESAGGQNIPNYRFDATHTAGGPFQITNSTWKNIGGPDIAAGMRGGAAGVRGLDFPDPTGIGARGGFGLPPQSAALPESGGGRDPIMDVADAAQAGGGDAPAAPAMASGLLTPGGPLTRQSPLPPIQPPPSMTAPQTGMLSPPAAPTTPPGMLGAGGPPAAMPALPGAAAGGQLPQVNPAYGNVLSAIAALRAKAGLAGISGNPFEGYVEAITKSPAYAAQLETAKRGAGLPWIAPEKEAEKSVELRYAGQIAEAVAAGQLPSQVVLKNVEAQNDLRNRLASGPVPTQISFDKDGVGTITPIRGGAEAAASAAGGVTRAQEQAKADVAAGTAPGIAGSTKYAETAATQDAAARAQAIAARNTLPLLDEAKQQLAGAGIFSGPAANLNLTLAQLATVAGWPNDKLVNTQTYIQQAGARAAEILRSGAYGTGSGISQNDLRAADKLANGDITLDIRSIQRILGLAERKAGRDIETFNAIAQKRDPATAIEHPPRLIGTTNTGKRVYRMPDGSQQVQD